MTDKWKLYLVKSGCIAQLLEIKVPSTIRRLIDIIILIVAKGKLKVHDVASKQAWCDFVLDECLDLLCGGSEVVSKAIEWISSDELSLETKASAALAMANIARNGMLSIRLQTAIFGVNFIYS